MCVVVVVAVVVLVICILCLSVIKTLKEVREIRGHGMKRTWVTGVLHKPIPDATSVEVPTNKINPLREG